MKTRLSGQFFASLPIIMALGLLVPNITSASLITSAGDLAGTPTVIDFSQFTGGNQLPGVNGPIQLGGLVGADVTVTDVSNSADLWLYDAHWGLDDNGTWNSGRVGFLGIYPGSGPARFDFNDGPISGVGAFMNYVPDDNYLPVYIKVYDSGDNLLETFNVSDDAPILTPGGVDDGAFRGIQRALSDIAYVEVFGDTMVLDNLSFTSAPQVPEPTSIIIWGSAIGLIASRRRKRK